MNIVYNLLQHFFYEEFINTFLMIITSFIINIIQTNGISYLTAKIIDFIHKNKKILVYDFFKYFVLVSIAYIFLYNYYKFFQNKLLTKLRQWMRHQLVKAMLIVNNENFSEINFTKLNSPINRISSVCFMVFNDMITYVLPNITFLIIISSYFLLKNTIFGVSFIIGNLILLVYLYSNWENMLVYNEDYEKHVNDTESYLQEILNNIDKIIYRGQTLNEIEVFSDKTNTSINKAFDFYSITSFHGTVMNCIVFIIIFLSIGYLIYLYFDKQIDFTIFVAFFTIILLYRDKMITIIQQIPDFIEFLGRSDSVLVHFKNMENSYDILKQNEKQYKKVNLEFNKIYFENVSFGYQSSDKLLFENLNLSLDIDNKIIGMVGLSGRGKSTFMKLVLKLYKPKNGNIFIDGQNIDNIDPDYIRNNITYVNQNSKLFDKKVIDNMLYGCSDVDTCNLYLNKIMQYKKINELYKNVDIYNQRSGALGENLSGGQRQIINIIGGLINPSKVLILDEPTNALDPELKRELLDLIRDFKKYKKSIIIITHDRDVHNLFDEVIKI
uniref:ABC transporter domain-containing protein n=1 Tax=viral metagenome TaxID=1070528 RepID=A0A6C0DBQ5_9ZZZZ